MTFKVSRSFRPPIAVTLALLLLASLFASLGTWQTRRAGEKLEIEQQHQAAAIVSLETALAKDQRFAQIDAAGHYDPLRHILLDNQIWQGRAGVHVFTPFYTLDGTAILVNRGWLPIAADRQSLPEIPTTQTEVVLRGMLNIPPVPGRIIGQADKLRQNLWPQLVTYLNLENIARSLNVPLESYVIQLSTQEQDGFEGRHWKPVFMTSTRHKAYAFQWFALTTASIVLWLLSGFREQPENSK
jgi:surfeit locus 1 family protein